MNDAPKMNFDTCWSLMVEKNPALQDESAKVTLGVGELKRLMRKFYGHGNEAIMPIATCMTDILKEFERMAGS
jgi:hypothetical protein